MTGTYTVTALDWGETPKVNGEEWTPFTHTAGGRRIDGMRAKWLSPDRSLILKTGGARFGAEYKVWEAMRDTWIGAVMVPTFAAEEGWAIQPFLEGCDPLDDYVDLDFDQRSPWFDLAERVGGYLWYYGYQVSDISPRQFLVRPNGDLALVDYEFCRE